MTNYFVSGYSPPKGVDSKDKVKQIQATLGVKQDGIWGARTQAAWNAQSTGKLAMPEAVSLTQVPRPQADYAVSGYTPPTGVTDRQMVRSIQANLGVPRDGIWGPKTQAAWEKQYGNLWQEPASVVQTTSKAYAPPKGIDSAEEIRQVQQRLRVKADGIWGRETQEAWTKMRTPQTSYQPPKEISVQQGVGKTMDVIGDRSPEGLRDTKLQAQSSYQAHGGIDRMEKLEEFLRRPNMTSNEGPFYSAQSEVDKTWHDRKNTSPIAQKKQQDMQKSLERYGELARKKEKVESYLSAELQQQRDPRDNSGITAMAALYRVFTGKRKREDADHIRAHMEKYNEEAVSGKSNVLSVWDKSGRQRYNANDKLVREALNAGLGIYDGLPPLENGQVSLEVIDGTPLFGLGPDKTVTEELIEYIIGLGAGTTKFTSWAARLAAVAKEFQWKEYFRYNPAAILEKGDVVIYYQSPQDTSGYGATYAFRRDELLYINSWEGNGRTVEFGSNYMQHAKKYKKSMGDALKSLGEGEIKGYLGEALLKKIFNTMKW
ncbi:MAG: hypothetical protein VB051_06300 [Candidatus Pelethousia sp.]|nr:hypothetical protein [Candidatus Pelethousia sp.]